MIVQAASLPGDHKTRRVNEVPCTLASAARLMDKILTPIPIHLISLKP
jgi:hypothetical protein